MPRVLGLPEVHGSLLWGYSNWMAYGQSYRDMDDWEPLFTILGHLHIIDTEDRRRSVRFWARRFAEALAQMLVLKRTPVPHCWPTTRSQQWVVGGQRQP